MHAFQHFDMWPVLQCLMFRCSEERCWNDRQQFLRRHVLNLFGFWSDNMSIWCASNNTSLCMRAPKARVPNLKSPSPKPKAPENLKRCFGTNTSLCMLALTFVQSPKLKATQSLNGVHRAIHNFVWWPLKPQSQT